LRNADFGLRISGLRKKSFGVAQVAFSAAGPLSLFAVPKSAIRNPKSQIIWGARMDSRMWTDMFHLGLPLLEKILRPVLVYIFLVAALRLAGKRELAELNPMDLVVLLMLSNTVQNAIIGDDTSLVGGIVGGIALLTANAGLARFVYKNKRLQRIVEGSTEDLIENGVVLEKKLDGESLSIKDLEAAARQEGLGSLDEVERAVLEASGRISFIPRKPASETNLTDEVLKRLDQISRELAELRASRA
jgi:uncharacterized membrane protein YcaP (DUF421 family)